MPEKGKRPRKSTSRPAETPVPAIPATAPKAASAGKETARPSIISPEERRRMIAEAAYFKAQRRGFLGGDVNRDWAEAELEIDALLLNRR